LQVGANTWQQLLDRAATMDSAIDRSLLGHQRSAVPGVETFSPGSLLLTADTTARACLEHAGLIRSKEAAVSFVTRLPAMKGSLQARPVAAATMPPPSPSATHVLVKSTAYPLTAACVLQDTDHGVSCRRQKQSNSQCTLGLHDDKLYLQILGDACIWLDGLVLSSGDPIPALAVGDSLSLTLKGQPVQLIRVSPDAKA